MRPLLRPPGGQLSMEGGWWSRRDCCGCANDRDIFFRAETLALYRAALALAADATSTSITISIYSIYNQFNTQPTHFLAAMDTDQVMDMVNLLDDQVDDIEEALAPLLKSTLQDIAAKLPVVDKARLYVLTTYAIDSLLFCTYSPPSPPGAPSLTTSSISETPWRQRPRTPRYARTRARQTVRQEDQRSAGYYNRGEA